MIRGNRWDQREAEQQIREALNDPDGVPAKTKRFLELIKPTCKNTAQAKAIAYTLSAGRAKPEHEWLDYVGTCLSHMAGLDERTLRTASRHYELLQLRQQEID